MARAEDEWSNSSPPPRRKAAWCSTARSLALPRIRTSRRISRRLRNHRRYSRSARERSPGAHPHRARRGPLRRRRLGKRPDHDHAADQGGSVFEPHGPLPSLGQSEAGLSQRRHAAAGLRDRLRHPREYQLVKPADEPKSWLDLTDPRWKGKISQRRLPRARRRRRAVLRPCRIISGRTSTRSLPSRT